MAIRWGILGCGDVTERKSGPGFQKARGSELVAVMRRNGDLAEDYARRHDVPRWYDHAAGLIDDPDVDAVYIATPPGTHLEYALQVCATRKPAYVEKPMARSHAECRRMVEAFAAARVPLFVAYYRRALPRFVKVKELLEAGRVGQVTSVSYHQSSPAHRNLDPQNLPWRLQAEHAGAGLFLDLASHTLDILDFLLGPLLDVSGLAANLASTHDVEDNVALHFRTAAGALGTASWNFASNKREDLIQISGTAGHISLATFGDDAPLLENEQGRESFPAPNPPHIQQPLIQSIVDELRGQSVCPSSGISAARTSNVMDAALSSYYGGRDDAFWTRPATWPGRRTERF